jgi:hypothetical protein
MAPAEAGDLRNNEFEPSVLKGEARSDADEGERRGVSIRAANGCRGCGDRLTAGSDAMVRDSLCSLESFERKLGLFVTLPVVEALSLRDSDFGGMAGVAGLES